MKLPVSQASGDKSGTTNNGPLVKRAFENPDLLAWVVNAPVNLVRGVKTLFEALNSGFLVLPVPFKEFTSNWLDELKAHPTYSWHVPSPTVHLVMTHGDQFLRKWWPVAPAVLSEEGAEFDNKTLRDTRDHHSRQTNDKDQTTDTFKRSHHKADQTIQDLLPDPKEPPKSFWDLPPEVRALLLDPALEPTLEPPDSEVEPPDTEVQPMDTE